VTCRSVLLVVHTGRRDAVRTAQHMATRLLAAGTQVVVQGDQVPPLELGQPGVTVIASDLGALDALEVLPDVVVVLGGDGSLLRAAELVRGTTVPLLGVNLGHVGFLAEAEPEDVDVVVDALLQHAWTVEERPTIDVVVSVEGEVLSRSWALNEAAVAKTQHGRMIDCVIGVDGRPLSSFAADGVVVSTSTGSTAYAFSAGGPVVWPDVEAMLVVPVAAHALFARPLVVSPRSTVAIELPPGDGGAVLTCDGRRTEPVPGAGRVEVRQGTSPVRLARLRDAPFTDRLVHKFRLPVTGWRGSE